MLSINDSQSFLYIIIAISILSLTFFVCWAVYYLVMILRQAFKTVKEMHDRFNKIDGIINSIEGMVNSLKEKVEHSASYLFLIGEGVKKLVEIMRGREDKKRSGSKKTRKDEE